MAQSLDATQRKLIDNALRDFRLAGVALDAERQLRFRTLMQQLAREQARFEENVLDCANAWSKTITDAEQSCGGSQPLSWRELVSWRRTRALPGGCSRSISPPTLRC